MNVLSQVQSVPCSAAAPSPPPPHPHYAAPPPAYAPSSYPAPPAYRQMPNPENNVNNMDGMVQSTFTGATHQQM